MSTSPACGQVDPEGIDLAALAVLPMVNDDDGAVAGLVPLARALVAVDTSEGLAGLSAGDLVDAARVFARLEAYAAGGVRRVAAQLERCSELTERVVTVSARRRDAEEGRDVTHLPAARTFRATETASDELVMSLGISRREASRLVAEGRAYGGDLAVVGDAVSEGYLSAPKASRLFDALAQEPLEVAMTVCEDLVPIAPALPAAEVERRARRMVIAADPGRAVERHERARGYRNVSPVRLLPDGMARIVVTSSVADVTAVHTVCDRAARAAKAAGDQRTLDQLRADTLTTLAAGALDAGSATGATATGTSATGVAVATRPAPASVPAPARAPDETIDDDDPPPWEVEASPAELEASDPVDVSVDRGERGPSPASEVPDRFDARGARALVIRRELLEAGSPDDDDRDEDTDADPNTGTGAGAGDSDAGDGEWLPRGLAQGWTDFLAPRTDPHAPEAPEPPPVPLPQDREPFQLGWLTPEIVGVGPLDHATARRLALHPPPWLRVVPLDVPFPGEAIQLPAEPGYRPSAALHRAVAEAHPTCVAPTCFVPVEACQDDHVIPYPQGPTSLVNLRPLCLRHHVLKTHRGHRYTADARGTVWTTAAGHRYLTTPAGTTIRLGRTRESLPGP